MVDVDSNQWTAYYWRHHCLDYVGGKYAWGKESPEESDCSGILRAWHRLEYTANDFFHKLYTEEKGTIGAVFLVDDEDFAYHVQPYVGEGVIVQARPPHITLVKWNGTGHLRFV